MNTRKIVSLIMLMVLSGAANAHPGGDAAAAGSSASAVAGGSGSVGGPGSGSISLSGGVSVGTSVLQGTSTAFDIAPPIVGSVHTHFGSTASSAIWGAGAAETGNGSGFVGGFSSGSTGGFVTLP